MIRTLSQVLKRILEDSRLSLTFPELTGSQISFERPSESFSPGQTTVNLFLYDIREHLELRSNEPTIERRNGQAIIHNPPQRIACSYLVTAWPVGGEELPLQEHRLLSQVLQVFSAYPTIPERPFLENTQLAGQEPPIPMTTAQVDGVQSAAEFWTALGTNLRASIKVTVTIGIPVFAPVTDRIVTTKAVGVGVGVEETLIQIGGQVQAQTEEGLKSVPNALIDILDTGLRTRTNKKGRYLFVQVPSGTHTIRVVAQGFEPYNQQLIVPGRTEDYQITLTPL